MGDGIEDTYESVYSYVSLAGDIELPEYPYSGSFEDSFKQAETDMGAILVFAVTYVVVMVLGFVAYFDADAIGMSDIWLVAKMLLFLVVPFAPALIVARIFRFFRENDII